MSQQDREIIFFVAWLLNKVGDSCGKTAADVYRRLESAGIVGDYIIPCFDVLHTMGESALVEDIQIIAAKRGVRL